MAKTTNVQSGMWNNAPNTHQAICIHDTESSTARGALSWMQSQQNGSYQDLVDLNGDVFLMVPDDKQAWAAMGTGNRIALHVCATGYASWSREKWLSYPAMLDSIAVIISQWSKKYGIPLQRIVGNQLRAGVRGVCGHRDISNAYRESDHTDPGTNFPFDYVIDRALQMLNGDSLDAAAINAFKRVFMSAIKSDVQDIDVQLGVWHQLGDRTFTDGLAAVLSAIEGGANGRNSGR